MSISQKVLSSIGGTKDVSDAVLNYTFTVAASNETPVNLYLKPDGTSMFVVSTGGTGGSPPDAIVDYTLTSPWELSSASYNSIITGGTLKDVFFKPDGSQMFVLFSTDITRYSLSSAWDITTFSSVSNTSITAESVFFKSDGTEMYFATAGGDVLRYTLSSAWDITSGSLTSTESISGSRSCEGLYFSNDGKKMYVLTKLSVNTKVEEYKLSTDWDPTTKVFVAEYDITQGSGLFFDNNFTKMYVCSPTSDEVKEWTIG